MITKQWIEQHCFTKTGKLNSRVCLESWWHNRNFTHILTRLQFNDCTISESLFMIYNNIEKKPVCKTCAGLVAFMQFKSGFREYCSNFCMTQSDERNAKISGHPTSYLKRKETILSMYGGESFKRPEIQEKARASKLEKYGTLHAGEEKRKATCLERYGVDHPYLSEEFQKKCQSAKLEKYGCFIPGNETITESKPEIEIREWLSSIGMDFPSSYGILPHGLQLDGYSADKKTAFEYCGLYWHSEAHRKAFYHKMKLQECQKLGVSLFTIFEDEWKERNSQVKQFISAKLGVFDSSIHARKCTFMEGNDRRQMKEFFDKNHIQSFSKNASRWFFLVHETEIVAGVSFTLHHRNSKELTLSRLAFKSGIHIKGGAGKLISNALKLLNTEVATWSDNRWTDGKLYGDLGFKNTANLAPDYSYCKGGSRVSKQSMKKSNTGCPENKTEHDFCLENGWLRIYDCGKRRWSWVPPSLSDHVTEE